MGTQNAAPLRLADCRELAADTAAYDHHRLRPRIRTDADADADAEKIDTRTALFGIPARAAVRP